MRPALHSSANKRCQLPEFAVQNLPSRICRPEFAIQSVPARRLHYLLKCNRIHVSHGTVRSHAIVANGVLPPW